MCRVSTVDMILCRTVAASLLLSALVVAAGPAFAQPKADTATVATPPPDIERPAPYDDDLLRLAEVLGSVHYLRNLCNPGKEDHWRAEMQQLLDSETKDEPKRKERLTAAFNRGYRSFASVYTDCTQQAIVAEERYRNEGATLATEITARFGN
ncbi:TIGR02301 family protein [Rhizobium sp. BK376]|uniref:TIGR02301 family protein n=1 Tax=Rhizobium sp. BK376 TaxID=2512149 RepID=UPI00104AAFD4|nr:TIGR02301 family protein [Rhizobium sp. BK376]